MNNQLVRVNTDGTLTTTSEIVAAGVDIQHKNVLETIRKNQADFEEFGRVAFETRTRQTAGGPQKTNIAVLNREQAMFAMTLFRNTPVVVDFKKNLIKAFIELEQRVAPQFPALPQDYATALRELAASVEEKEKAQAELEAARPKVVFADAVATSKSEILIGELAKILRGNGIQIGQTRLFTWMRENGFLIRRKGTDWNMPTQRAMELGLFRIKETAVTHSDGHVSVNKTPKVTGAGQQYFVERFLDGRFRVGVQPAIPMA
ncbi:phage regulatory protein/antirepressor Ant [Corynebacterium macginleyi]|uniref:phage regulatory protein/antirepressor Ant n=1 Tax=Corynebacterium macginleyi TaxID=38290 RepID=UPI001F308039|nr:phage regulatory protein/antirepressor Ant [Corynebacterium macginleyi]